jgi:hypothetical protein
MEQAALKKMKEVEFIRKNMEHRPINPNQETDRQFLIQTLLNIQQIMDKNPYICPANEEKEITKIGSISRLDLWNIR